MTTGLFRQTGIYVAICVLAAAFAAERAPCQESAGTALVHGYVRDSNLRPVANAAVALLPGSWNQPVLMSDQITHTDSEGHYRFAALRAGLYSLRAQMTGYDEAMVSGVNLAQDETTKIDLVLAPSKAFKPMGGVPPAKPATEKASAQAPEFFDEPQFTVAGVTQATNSGGHGSDTMLRTTEALARATLSLSKEADAGAEQPPAATESSLRDAVARNPKDPALHHRLGDVEEKSGNPLAAVQEYQQAAELDPSEPNLFDWGTELLTHRALAPATEIFTRGNHLYPTSVRMLVALGVAWYARGSYEQATQFLMKASDIAPDNPTPYLFLGKMQSEETTPAVESVERLGRFAQLQPDRALANYYYAVGLWKQGSGAADSDAERSARVESLLQKAVRLDPKLSAAYLQLGIVYSQRTAFSQAISAYQKAIKVSPEADEALGEAHYRLAQAYRRTGNQVKAQKELQLHRELAKKTKEDSERQRREIQEFVVSLRK